MKYNKTYHVENVKKHMENVFQNINFIDIFSFIQDYYIKNQQDVVRKIDDHRFKDLILEVKYTKEFEKAFSLWVLSK